MTEAPGLIIPVESKVREMDAKLLLACCAVERGYCVFIGSRAHVHFAIAGLPRGIYVERVLQVAAVAGRKCAMCRTFFDRSEVNR